MVPATSPSLLCCAVMLLCYGAQAIAATGKIVKANPKHLGALQLRGLAYMYLGDHDLAKRHFGEDKRESRLLHTHTVGDHPVVP